jgi:hypothetical protein
MNKKPNYIQNLSITYQNNGGSVMTALESQIHNSSTHI